MPGAVSAESFELVPHANLGAGYDRSMTQDSTFMRMALAQAEAAKAAGEIPVGAVVVKNGQVIGVGRNTPIASHDPSAHAEIVAMRAAAQQLGNYRLEGCELYVTLEPCAMCAGAMLHARIQRVIYGAADSKTGAAGSVLDLFAIQQLNHHTQVSAGVLSDECSGTLRTFFQERRQEREAHAQPLMDDALRTPKAAFASIQDYPFASKFFSNTEDLCGWRMHYLDEGPAESACTVLCLHDLPGWSYHYRHLISALSARGLRVIAPDLIGFGMSDKPKKIAAHTLQLHLRSLQSLLMHLAPSKVLVLAEGQGVHLANAWMGSEATQILEVFQVPSCPDAVADGYPYPDQGHQAALRASPGLLEQLNAVSPSTYKNPVLDVFDGQFDVWVDRIEAVFCDG